MKMVRYSELKAASGIFRFLSLSFSPFLSGHHVHMEGVLTMVYSSNDMPSILNVWEITYRLVKDLPFDW